MPQLKGDGGDPAVATTPRDGAPSIPDDVGSGRRMPTIARWPLDVEVGFERFPWRDPFTSLVRDSLVAYREGRTDVAHWSWAPDILWRVKTNGNFGEEHAGPEAIFAYHVRLGRLSDGTFRQRLVALQSSNGPIVEAHLRSTARRGERELDMPTLVVFELAGGRIRLITEMPGDPYAWRAFWGD